MINIPDKGFVYRYYIMSAGFEYKTVIFKIRVPDAAFKEDPSKYWPKNLPKPHGKITQVIALKDKAIWALYETDSYADQAFTRYASSIGNSGFKLLSTDKKSGAVYFDPSSTHMLFFSTVEGKDKSHGAIFYRRIKKK